MTLLCYLVNLRAQLPVQHYINSFQKFQRKVHYVEGYGYSLNQISP